MHEELRIKGAQTIKNKTMTSSISDLMSFDIRSFFEDQYKHHIVYEGIDQYAQHIIHEEIDQQKLGKWLSGCTKIKNISRRKFISIGVNAAHFCEINYIYTYADLVKYLKMEKVKIKSRRGRRSSMDYKILSVKNYSMFRKN